MQHLALPQNWCEEVISKTLFKISIRYRRTHYFINIWLRYSFYGKNKSYWNHGKLAFISFGVSILGKFNQSRFLTSVLERILCSPDSNETRFLRIPDSTSENFSDSGIQIPLHPCLTETDHDLSTTDTNSSLYWRNLNCHNNHSNHICIQLDVFYLWSVCFFGEGTNKYVNCRPWLGRTQDFGHSFFLLWADRKLLP